MLRPRRCVRAVLVVMLVTTACTGGSSSTGRSSSATPTNFEIPRGGTLRLGVLFWQYPNDVQILDPQEPFGIFPETEMLRCCLVRTLYSYNGQPTEQGGAQPRPDLATGAPAVSEDGLTWTFHIQRGLHYGPPLQDVEITTSDIVRALERAADPSIAAAFPLAYADVHRRTHPFDFDLGMIQGFGEYENGSAEQISGLETPDPHTLVVHLDRVTTISSTGSGCPSPHPSLRTPQIRRRSMELPRATTGTSEASSSHQART